MVGEGVGALDVDADDSVGELSGVLGAEQAVRARTEMSAVAQPVGMICIFRMKTI